MILKEKKDVIDINNQSQFLKENKEDIIHNNPLQENKKELKTINPNHLNQKARYYWIYIGN